ncbi:uncharacterized protein [Primulina huaijiensis]|uniref:uncharacterized protein n=1 Tax=Primulina huaijiensis TaxID=1492673 RepID=UPI003CC73E78
MEQVVIIEKILRSMTSRFDYVVCSIEESNNLDILTIDELQSSLLVHEQRMNGHGGDEQALKVTYDNRVGGRGGDRARGASRGRGRGRGRQAFNKAMVECYKCHQLGHFQYECPKWEKEANYAELEEKEEMLLTSYVELNQSRREYIWFLDSGCSNHMCANKQWFSDLDEEFQQSVTLGNNSKMAVLGKGNIRMQIAGVIQVITDVFYILKLKNNLLSIGKLQERCVAILIQHGVCRIYHPKKGLIMQTAMSANRMFILLARILPTAPICFQTILEDNTHLWHCRYGHLSFKGLRTLQNKQMVRGLPQLKAPSKICTDCMVGKQHRDAIPKRSSWRASQRLQLVHADICGPIKHVSNSEKRITKILLKKRHELLFVEQPHGYEKKGEEYKVYKLKKALYGLKQAPRAWYSQIEAYFVKEGFERCSCEHTLFIKPGDEGKILIASLYVDDLIFTGNDESMFVKFKNSMKLEFDMTDLGKMKYFLGVEVLQNPEGIYICQRKYAKEVLERFKMEKSNSVKNPIVPGARLMKNEKGAKVNATMYKQLVGSLMYLTATRPDLMYVVCLISRFMASPTELHLQAAKSVLRYLKGTMDLGVFYRKEGSGELMAYTDSDYAGDVDDRKSTSGYVFLLSERAVS